MAQEKSISDRIRYIEDDQELRIEIKAGVEKHKENILLGWLILWVIIGISMIYFLFTEEFPDEQTKIIVYVFLGFWTYYMYKVYRTYRWLTKGVEELVINDTHFSLTNLVGQRGLPMKYPIHDVSKVQIRQVDIKSFQYQMENSFWVIGGDRLQMNYQKKPFYFGKRLEETEARKLITLVNDQLKIRANNRRD